MLAVTDQGKIDTEYKSGPGPVLLAVTLRPGGNDLNLTKIILLLFVGLCMIVGTIF